MRLRHIKNSENIINNSIYFTNSNKKSLLYDSKDLFGNSKLLCIEIGMGKGKFICQTAKQNKFINFIGIEKYATVCLKAINNYENIFLNDIKENYNNNLTYEQLYQELTKLNHNLLNLKLLCINANDLNDYFKPKSIAKIFLNFNDPWSKNRYKDRRLTSEKYLNIYKQILNDNGIIEFRTDNNNLFDFSLTNFDRFGYEIIFKTTDLEKAEPKRIKSEYEEKFVKNGKKINKLIAKIKNY